MPELPEVETMKRDLSLRLIGRFFVGANLQWPRAVQTPSPEEFCNRLQGMRIDEIDRRGKYLIFRLSNGEALILHFRMSGSVLLDSGGASDPYTRNTFHLDNGAGLYFRDPRKLGLVWLVADENIVVGKLGPEPLDPTFTAAHLGEWAKRYSAPIKAVLCDQRFIAGIGNMYADEALFAASLHPLRATNSLSADDVERLYKSIRRVLEEAIGSYGASMNDYRRPNGEAGTAQSIFKVAHRVGKPCPVCGTIIQRIPIRQRGAYFCPNCQCKS